MIYQYKDIDAFLPFFSASDSQIFLKKNYNKLGIIQADQKSYENCYPFIYYLEHAKVYYQQATQSPLLIKPILLFYGFVQLIKACLLAIDPNYPENTSMLAHGVSARKRKKQHYEFFQDEVKFQKHGLFPCMLEKLFHIKFMEGEKVPMHNLFQQIPELNSLFHQLCGTPTFLKLLTHQDKLIFSKKILDSFHMTENRFIDFLQHESSHTLTFKESVTDSLLFDYCINHNNLMPLKYNQEDQHYYFPLNRDKFLSFPEIISHYLLLYNLSMIARYETEWWSELVKTIPNKDFPFIFQFLNITEKKGPFLVYQYLQNLNE